MNELLQLTCIEWTAERVAEFKQIWLEVRETPMPLEINCEVIAGPAQFECDVGFGEFGS